MKGFKIIDGFNCINSSHVGEGIIAICMNLKCTTQNRFLCFKCMIGNNHRPHIQDCILFHFAHKFIENTLQILQKTSKLSFTNNQSQEILIKQFFQRKKHKLNKIKNEINNLNQIKYNVQYIEFAFNILYLQQQFVKGCHQIIDKNHIIAKLETIFVQNISIYIEEAQTRCHNLRLNYLYEEAIQCCDAYLSFKLDSQLWEIKGNCLHFLDRLDDALEIYSCAQNLFPNEEKFKILQIMLQESIDGTLSFPDHDIPLFLKKAFYAKNFILQMKFQEALQELDECKQEDSEIYMIIALKAQCFFELNQNDEAKKSCSLVFQIYPKYYKTITLFARILLLENKHDQLGQYVETFKDKFHPMVKATIISQSFLNRNKFDEAEKILNEIPDQLKNEQSYLTQKVKLMIQKKKFFEAEESAKLIEQISQLDSIINQVWIKLAESKYGEALELTDQGLKLDSKHLKLLKYRVICLLKYLRYKEASKTYEIMKNLYPNSQEVKEISGYYMFLDPDIEKQYVKQNANNLDLLYKKAKMFGGQDRYEEALKIYQQILTIDVHQLKAELSEIQCLILTQNIKIAFERIEYILNYNKDCLEAYFLKGFALYRIEKYQEAYNCFKKLNQKIQNIF